MSEKIYIEKEKLKQCLEKAFDEGWAGYRDLKEEVVLTLLEEAEKNCAPPVTTTWGFGTGAYVSAGTTYAVGSSGEQGIVLNVSNNIT